MSGMLAMLIFLVLFAFFILGIMLFRRHKPPREHRSDHLE
jgi:hypothetical protein